MRPIAGIEILEELGRGGMGVVYRGRHPQLGTVAVKVMLGLEFEDKLRFQREAEAAARIQSPYVVPVHQVGDSDGRPYMVMELVEGDSLSERIRREGSLPEAVAARLAAQLAQALAAAHREGVLHRDLKPANVFLDAQGDALLGDFGLALLADKGRLTQTGTVVGSPSYMAPEQALGERDRIGPPTDVYALGATLYEMLTGVAPFPGESVASIMSAVVSQPVVRPRELRPGLSAELEGICLKCLEKDPALRYESADAVAEVLDAFLGRTEPSLRAVQPRRAGVGVAAAGLILLGVAAALGILWGRGGGSPASSTPPPRPTELASTPSRTPSVTPSPSTPPPSPARQRLELQPGPLLGKDTYARGFGFYVNDNYGCGPQLVVGTRDWGDRSQWGYFRSYIRFDLSRLPPGAEVESASLELTSLAGVDRGEVTLRVWYAAGGAWVEGSSTLDYYLDGLCWQGDFPPSAAGWKVDSDRPEFDQPGYALADEPLASGVATGEDLLRVGFDVTEAVRAWSGGERENQGLCLTTAEGGPVVSGRVSFCSSDWPVPHQRPRLVVHYTGSPPLPSTEATDERLAQTRAEQLLELIRARREAGLDLGTEDFNLAGEAIRTAPHWWRAYVARAELFEQLADSSFYAFPNALRDLRGATLQAPPEVAASTLRPRVLHDLRRVFDLHGKGKLREQLYFYEQEVREGPDFEELRRLAGWNE